jgi:hypothetical protein
MKFIILLATLLSTQAFAFDMCSFHSTGHFIDVLESKGISHSRVSEDHNRFTFNEKKMIHLTITFQDWLQGASLDEALKVFGENYGEIIYYKVEGRTIALVHYFPGDNEYGAFYEVRGRGAFKFLAQVQDGDIYCQEN